MLNNFKEKYKTDVNLVLFWLCFLLYFLIFIWVIGFKTGNPRSLLGPGYSLNPITLGPNMVRYMNYSLYERFIYDFVLRKDSFFSIFKDVLLNIIIFLPYGILLSVIIKKHKILLSGLLGFLLSLMFELFQLFTAFGSFSFLDLISNTLGSVFGSLCYLMLVKIIKPNKVNFAINICTSVVVVVLIPVLIYAVSTIVHNFDIIAYKWNYNSALTK